MNRDYVIVSMATDGLFNIGDDKQIILIDSLKVDKNMNKIDEFRVNIKSKEEIIKFIEFCGNSKIIIYNAKDRLSFLLKSLYKNNIISNFKFKYIDIIDLLKKNDDVNYELTLSNIKNYYNIFIDDDNKCILDIVKNYLIENNIANLDDLFLTQPFHGKIFRGLNYPKYLCDVKVEDNKYYGYIVDFSNDKYVSYYACLKELNGEYFSLDEIEMLKKCGAKVIMNVMYLCDESLSFVDYYSILAVDDTKVTKNCYKLLCGIDRFMEYYRSGKKIKLILWGSLDKLFLQYEIIDRDKLESLVSCISLVKEPWDYFTRKDLLVLDKDR